MAAAGESEREERREGRGRERFAGTLKSCLLVNMYVLQVIAVIQSTSKSLFLLLSTWKPLLFLAQLRDSGSSSNSSFTRESWIFPVQWLLKAGLGGEGRKLDSTIACLVCAMADNQKASLKGVCLCHTIGSLLVTCRSPLTELFEGRAELD